MEIYSDFSKIMHLIKSDKKLNIEFMDNKTNKLYDTYNSSLNTMDDSMSSAIYGDSAPEPYTGVRSSDTSYNYKTKILSHDPQNKKILDVKQLFTSMNIKLKLIQNLQIHHHYIY